VLATLVALVQRAARLRIGIAVALPRGMHRLIPAIVLAGLSAVACINDAQQVAEARVAEFQRSADAGDLAAIRRWHDPKTPGWETYMRGRLRLGRTTRTSREYIEDVSSPGGRVINLTYNTEFERGYSYERFEFVVDGTGPRLDSYKYQVGKRAACFPMGGCDVIDAPRK
jgi:hypothetical protein